MSKAIWMGKILTNVICLATNLLLFFGWLIWPTNDLFAEGFILACSGLAMPFHFILLKRTIFAYWAEHR